MLCGGAVQVDFSKLVVYHTKRSLGSSLFISALHPDVAAGMDVALAFLEQQGATLVDFQDEECEAVKEMFTGLNAFRVWSSLMSKHRHEPFAVTIREGLGDEVEGGKRGSEMDGGNPSPSSRMTFMTALVELLKSLVDLSCNTFPAMVLAVVEFISDLPLMDSENEHQCAEGLRLKDELEFLLSPEYQLSPCDKISLDSEVHDSGTEHNHQAATFGSTPSGNMRAKVLSREHVLLLPSLPTPAPFHAESLLRVFDTSNTAFFNVMELPVTAVPLGLSTPRSSGGNGNGQRHGAGAGAGAGGTSSSRRHRGKPQQKRGQLGGGANNLPVGMQVVGGPGRDHVSNIEIEIE